MKNNDERPNVLFVMTDQQRFDTIRALGNSDILTPNLDRLVERGVAFTNAYSTCPVCVPARYTARTGCEPPATRVFSNRCSGPEEGQAGTVEGRCGPYLAKAMRERGYRTFGIGKFHSKPWDEDLGYDVHLHSEELYGEGQRPRDAFAAWIAEEHPEFDYIEALMGERTEMYYMPQVSPLPPELTVESWAADRAVEQIGFEDEKPYFGFVSFIGPHPPFAPPLPFNRMYDPDRMENPVVGDPETDHMDEQIPRMNRNIWADDISPERARILKARYYGEITYIDDCIGRILDAVEASPKGENTLICFFTDHGDHLGDHDAWQKESFFDAACRIPFLVSWPEKFEGGGQCEELVCLTDLFAIATGACGEAECRDGIDVLGMLEGRAEPRKFLAGYYEEPGTPFFKIMIRRGKWKYIFMANGGREQLFDLESDPCELKNMASENPELVAALHGLAVQACSRPGAREAISSDGGGLKRFSYRERERGRVYQFDRSRGVTGFPENPEDLLEEYKAKRRSLA